MNKYLNTTCTYLVLTLLWAQCKVLGMQRLLKLSPCSLRRYWIIQKKSYAFTLVIWLMKKTVNFLTLFFLQNLLDFSGLYTCRARLRFSCSSSDNCRLICPLNLINLDFKFDLGDNVILDVYKAELLDNVDFSFFVKKVYLMLYGNKILHGSLREGSSPSFLWLVTLIFPSQSVLPRWGGRMGEKTIFCKSFWLHVKCRMEMSLSVFNFFSYTSYDVLLKTHTGNKY